ncbi:MAG TPA: F0F1 ATP synthase subunit B' [Epsilonproteobacteria bacterium]|nr:F0F1 ATP synthase subunit B' [Campylobacterota bacterium]
MLDIHPNLMLFVLVVFLLLIFLLNTLLFKPLLTFIDQREKSINADLEATKKLTGNSDELHAKADEVVNRAKSEAMQIKQKAFEEAKLLASSKVETKQKELEKTYQEFLETLVVEKQSLKNTLLSQMPLLKEGLKAKFSKL